MQYQFNRFLLNGLPVLMATWNGKASRPADEPVLIPKVVKAFSLISTEEYLIYNCKMACLRHGCLRARPHQSRSFFASKAMRIQVL